MKNSNQITVSEYVQMYKTGQIGTDKKGKLVTNELLPEYRKMLEEKPKKTKKPSKYRNEKVVFEGINFDSKKERDAYIQYNLRKGTLIKDFKRQVNFPYLVEGKKMFSLILDFVVKYTDGTTLYVDIKPFDKKTGKYLTTAVFNLKKKLIENQYKIKIELK